MMNTSNLKFLMMILSFHVTTCKDEKLSPFPFSQQNHPSLSFLCNPVVYISTIKLVCPVLYNTLPDQIYQFLFASH